MADPTDNARDYKQTTRLPNTPFPMKANLAQREPAQLAAWEKDGLYPRLLAAAEARQATPWVLHDGPPYANGHLHEGHFLNKILKDIAVKHRLMLGQRATYIPGWDCHGLPIELAASKELGSRAKELDKVAFRKACRAHADKFIHIQRDEFKRLGVFGLWDQPYSTMDFGYEAQTVRTLAQVVREGAVYRGKKPVFWCWNDRTALAEAEIEYEDHVGPSIYVGFDAVDAPGKALSHALPSLAHRQARYAIWTTTPWTLPANLAISARADFVYVAYELRGVPTVIARDLLFSFLSAVAPEEIVAGQRVVAGEPLDTASLVHPERILGYVEGRALEGLRYRHPFLDRVSQVILGDHVTLEAGTGLVHTAPGHGQEDYEVGLKYGLPVLVPVDAGGVLTAEAGPFAGQFLEKANPLIEAKLAESGHLLNPPGARISHSYPHCWRCKKPVILRATDQWFISMEKTKLRARALAEIEKVEWIPAWGKERIKGMLLSRPDWCVSRQRAWGVPIPALYCESCGEGTLDADVLDQIAGWFEQEGADAWFARPVQELAPGVTCKKCGSQAFAKEHDILDVWFDSGVSQAAVAEKRLGWPADLYLEGSDQHRGWFQASLLCALAAGKASSPFRACLTHGFVVDGQGRKLSKSLGNSLDPQKMLRQYGAEIVRLWAGSEDYRDDIRLSDEILQRLSDAYRKIRNTLRYALGVLGDFDPAKHAVPHAQLLPLDAYLRDRLHRFIARARESYDAYDFHAVTRAAVDFVSIELSALHFDVSKDRLYCAGEHSRERRSAQTVIHETADALCRLLAPILSFTMEEVYACLPGRTASVFFAGLPALDPGALFVDADAAFAERLAVRSDVQSALEELRRKKEIGSSQEARVELWAKDRNLGSADALAELLIVSEIALQTGAEPADAVQGERSGLKLRVGKASGQKCDRCWSYRPTGESRHGGFVCTRCVGVLKGLGL